MSGMENLKLETLKLETLKLETLRSLVNELDLEELEILCKEMDKRKKCLQFLSKPNTMGPIPLHFAALLVEMDIFDSIRRLASLVLKEVNFIVDDDVVELDFWLTSIDSLDSMVPHHTHLRFIKRGSDKIKVSSCFGLSVITEIEQFFIGKKDVLVDEMFRFFTDENKDSLL
jgi:hypothetical protein